MLISFLNHHFVILLLAEYKDEKHFVCIIFCLRQSGYNRTGFGKSNKVNCWKLTQHGISFQVNKMAYL